MAAQRSIVQIIPAGSWKARFKTTQPGMSGLPKAPLACWALVETDVALGAPNREIVGMIVSAASGQAPLVYADEQHPFDGYELTR